MVPPAKKQISVMLVDDEPLVREGLGLLVGLNPSQRVVAEAGNGVEAVASAGRAQPDVILLDVNLNGENGLDLIKPLAKASGAKVLVLTGAADHETYLKAMRCGAMGLLYKSKKREVLYRAIESVHKGEVWFDRVLLGQMQQERSRPARANGDESAKVSSLSEREREVVKVLGEGVQNEEIAERLNIEPGTVKRHLSNIYTKLDVKDRFELAIFAFRHGLAELPR